MENFAKFHFRKCQSYLFDKLPQHDITVTNTRAAQLF